MRWYLWLIGGVPAVLGRLQVLGQLHLGVEEAVLVDVLLVLDLAPGRCSLARVSWCSFSSSAILTWYFFWASAFSSTQLAATGWKYSWS